MFGIPGAHMYDFNDALARRADAIRFITARHEQGAGYMAFGYAKSTGRVGVYTVVPGPGVLNSAAALCTAYGATAPVLCITGNIMSHLIGRGRGQLHELPDQLALLRGLTKWAERIDHPTAAPQVMAEAFRQLASGRIRPVAVETPWDVFGQKAEVAPPLRSPPIPAPLPDPDSIAAAAKLIAAAKRPLISVGAGALHAGPAVQRLASLLQAPVTAHRSGKGIVSDDSPYALNSVAAYEYWKDADLLIGIGSRLELQHFRWRWLPRDLKTVRIDIDPTEMVRLKPHVGIVADSLAAGTAALDRCARVARSGAAAPKEAEFAALRRARARIRIERIQPQMGYIDAIREVSAPGRILRRGNLPGRVSPRASDFPVYGPRQYVTCGYQDNLGFGFNTALGVKVANPGKAVVAICGDGGFHVRQPGTRDRGSAAHCRGHRPLQQSQLRQRAPRSEGTIPGANLGSGPRESGLPEIHGQLRRAGTSCRKPDGTPRRPDTRPEGGSSGRHRDPHRARRRNLALAVVAPAAPRAASRVAAALSDSSAGG